MVTFGVAQITLTRANTTQRNTVTTPWVKCLQITHTIAEAKWRTCFSKLLVRQSLVCLKIV